MLYRDICQVLNKENLGIIIFQKSGTVSLCLSGVNVRFLLCRMAFFFINSNYHLLPEKSLQVQTSKDFTSYLHMYHQGLAPVTKDKTDQEQE